MAKKRTADRRMITVPADLNARMAKHPAVNWSAVACRAFEVKLGELVSHKKDKTMKDVVERLRASKIEADDQVYRDGREAGEAWAKEAAEAVELKRLELRREMYGSDWGRPDINGIAIGHNAADIAEAIAERDDLDGRDIEEFWEAAVGGGGQHEDDEFVRGFVDGALKVWGAVKNQI